MKKKILLSILSIILLSFVMLSSCAFNSAEDLLKREINKKRIENALAKDIAEAENLTKDTLEMKPSAYYLAKGASNKGDVFYFYKLIIDIHYKIAGQPDASFMSITAFSVDDSGYVVEIQNDLLVNTDFLILEERVYL